MEYRFCPQCGGELELKQIKHGEPKRLVCRRCGFIFFLDPKVAAGTIFRVDGGVVLIKRGIEPGYGKWVFPGGFVDRGETAEEAAIRETQEEVKVDVSIDRILNVYSYPGFPTIVIVYAARCLGGTPQVGDEALDVKIFSPGEIPWSDLAFNSTRDALQDYMRLYFPSR
ncbi:MAG TPA: NUDIX hydrolase [bacterium]|nr:MAG: NUDIX hydrolase [Acidobacteria bacterium RIFCSPLOWO2_02_FULL_59_13]HLC27413.1 NUDIX hydrolase [bacterium]